MTLISLPSRCLMCRRQFACHFKWSGKFILCRFLGKCSCRKSSRATIIHHIEDKHRRRRSRQSCPIPMERRQARVFKAEPRWFMNNKFIPDDKQPFLVHTVQPTFNVSLKVHRWQIESWAYYTAMGFAAHGPGLLCLRLRWYDRS